MREVVAGGKLGVEDNENDYQLPVLEDQVDGIAVTESRDKAKHWEV